jgi:hypothetical protein
MQMGQPTPTVTRTDVERIARRDFGEAFATVLAALDATGVPASPRVHLAALKLAHGELRALKQALDIAKADYRDVPASAEYPLHSRRVASTSPPAADEVAAVYAADWKQYQDWLLA